MHVWRMRLQYISVQITHCKQPLSTSRWFPRREECSIVTVLSSIMNHQQKSWAVQIKIPFSVSIAWTSILIHTNQANYSDLGQGHPKCWFKGTLPPKSQKKKISFRNHRIIMDNCFPVYIAFQNQVFPCFVTSTMTRPKRCYFSKALGDFDLWWQLQSEPSIRLRPRLRGR